MTRLSLSRTRPKWLVRKSPQGYWTVFKRNGYHYLSVAHAPCWSEAIEYIRGAEL